MLNGSANGRFSALLMTKSFTINELEQKVFDAGGVETVASLLDCDLTGLQHAEPTNFKKEVAKTLYELSVGREDIKERIAGTGVIPKLVGLLDVHNNHLRGAVLKLLYGLAVNEKAKVSSQRLWQHDLGCHWATRVFSRWSFGFASPYHDTASLRTFAALSIALISMRRMPSLLYFP